MSLAMHDASVHAVKPMSCTGWPQPALAALGVLAVFLQNIEERSVDARDPGLRVITSHHLVLCRMQNMMTYSTNARLRTSRLVKNLELGACMGLTCKPCRGTHLGVLGAKLRLLDAVAKGGSLQAAARIHAVAAPAIGILLQDTGMRMV